MKEVRLSSLITLVSTPPIAESAEWARHRKTNRELLNLSQAVPSYPPAEELRNEIARLALLPETGLYTAIRGIDELRSGLAQHMIGDYGGAMEPDDVSITAGCNQAFCAALMALAERGDNVILPAPYYFNHQMWLAMLGIDIKVIPAFSDGRNHPLPEDAARLIDDRTRAIILCTPNNPTGAIYSPQIISAFYELARERGIALVIDETYKDFRDGPAPAHELFQQSDWRNTFVQLYSFSKTYAMTGYRAGSVIAGPRISEQMEKILDCMAICTPAISQGAALFGLQHLAEWAKQKVAMMAERRTALIRSFGNPKLNYRLASSGAYFAYVRHPFPGIPAKAVAQRLTKEHDVLCLPGSMFGPGQEDYLRLAFANVPAEAMAVLADRLIESQG